MIILFELCETVLLVYLLTSYVVDVQNEYLVDYIVTSY